MMVFSMEVVLETAQRFLEEKKVEDITRIDLRSRGTITDYFLIGTVQSSRQMMATAFALHEYFKKEAIPALIEGNGSSDWVLVDLGAVIVHLMKPEARQFYQIEAIWDRSQTLKSTSIDG